MALPGALRTPEPASPARIRAMARQLARAAGEPEDCDEIDPGDVRIKLIVSASFGLRNDDYERFLDCLG